MKQLLPADRKALALAAWLFYAERGFAAELIHVQNEESIDVRVIYDDTQELPMCQQLMHPSFTTTVTRVGYSDKVFNCHIPDAFL